MNLIAYIHGRFVHQRRVQVLGRLMASYLPAEAHVLDVGCGDGRLAQVIQSLRPDVVISGIDVHLRPACAIPVKQFDGATIPFADGHFDGVLLADVLHHTADPLALLRESARVSRTFLLIKDHVLEGIGAESTLRLMDTISNRRHGVALPFNYWTLAQWRRAFEALHVAPIVWITKLNLYPGLWRYILERKLHFVAYLNVAADEGASAQPLPSLKP